MAGPVLDVSGLSVSINERAIVENVDLHLEAGQTLALVGESGCGKSMTALALIGLLPEGGQYASGSILMEGDDLAAFSPSDWQSVRGLRIGMIFQDPGASLDPLMTIGGQVGEALALRGVQGGRARREAARAMLSDVGIPDPDKRLNQYPFELSGGMAQRAMIAIALAARPTLLIADEPTTALDVTIQAQILALMQDLQAETGTAILLITHDIGVVSEASDRVAVMYSGAVIETGETDAVLSAPRHPYTQALLKSIPTLQAQRGAVLDVIEGTVPEPGVWPDGCRFAPRCPHVRDVCRAAVPSLEPLANDRAVACIRHKEIAA